MLSPGDRAPDFDLPDLAGEPWSLRTSLASGPVLLAFFKISCETCQFTFPFLQRLPRGKELGSPRLITISQDDALGTSQFHTRFQLSLPTLLDKAWDFPVSNLYKISHVPSLFLIEPDGRISLSVEGFSRPHLEQIGTRFGVTIFGSQERIPLLRPG